MRYYFNNYQQSELIRNHLHMGGENPNGERIDVTNLYFERGNRPWIGVMGEYHFSRAHKEDWHRELCKMKAGGITVVATYMFWIYHEEIEGEFDFSGDLDIGAFIRECKKLGLDVVLRLGPWAHGECRNGGFPDWLLNKPYALRDNNPEYMKKARTWYEKIYEQVKEMLYKDGGNIIAIQIENELVDNAGHLKALKELAVEIGLDVPIYTVTGWNNKAGAEIPIDEMVPVFGGYVVLPWEPHTKKLPPSIHYFFNRMRNDSAIGTDLIPHVEADGWQLPYEKYPFTTCELGGGIQITHHRRPVIRGMDIYALSLVKLGCGNNLLGYYMYHGGTNKIGRLSTFNESKATGYPNDYPILSYDFQAPISEYGEIREHYRLLNILHLFVNDFGSLLAPMEAVDSKEAVAREDVTSLRYGMRTDGEKGFVFVNHYQRLYPLMDVKDVVIDTGSVVFPAFDVCGEISFFFPYNMPLGNVVLEYVAAQPVCQVGNTYFFAAVDGIIPQYKFINGDVFALTQKKTDEKSVLEYETIECNGSRIVTLTWNQARFIRKLSGNLYLGKDCDIYLCDGEICIANDGEFTYYEWNGMEFKEKRSGKSVKTASLSEQSCEEPFIPVFEEELNLGGMRKRIWKKLSVDSPVGVVEICYEGDVAQIYADGELIADEFYKGTPWRVAAKLLYGKECYLVFSEMKNDFYKEF